MNIQPGDLYAKNGKDFRVHEIREGQVYGVIYYTEDRATLDTENDYYALVRHDIDKFIAEAPELIERKNGVGK